MKYNDFERLTIEWYLDQIAAMEKSMALNEELLSEAADEEVSLILREMIFNQEQMLRSLHREAFDAIKKARDSGRRAPGQDYQQP